jgi:hypothetical protein
MVVGVVGRTRKKGQHTSDGALNAIKWHQQSLRADHDISSMAYHQERVPSDTFHSKLMSK